VDDLAYVGFAHGKSQFIRKSISARRIVFIMVGMMQAEAFAVMEETRAI